MTGVIRRVLPLLLLPALLVGCSDDEPEPAAATAAPTGASTTSGAIGAACTYLSDTEVSDALGNTVEGVPTGTEICSWGELDLSVLAATPTQFDEERDINSADADEPPPPLGLGEDSYLILGEGGGTGSAGVYKNGRKAVLQLPGALPQDAQRQILTLFAGRVASQL